MFENESMSSLLSCIPVYEYKAQTVGAALLNSGGERKIAGFLIVGSNIWVALVPCFLFFFQNKNHCEKIRKIWQTV